MKKKSYSIEIKQKRGEDIVSIEFGSWKKINYKYNKEKRFFQATLIGFDESSKEIEYVDVISVIKTIRKR